MKLLFPFFQWCDASWLGSTIRNSPVLFPIIEAVHLFALTLLLGTTIVLSLRLLGLIFRRQAIPDFAREMRPWTSGSLAVMLLSGTLLFFSEAVKCYGNLSFRSKMVFLAAALAYHFTGYRKLIASAEIRPIRAKLGGAFSLLLWFAVGLAGRGIGFLG